MNITATTPVSHPSWCTRRHTDVDGSGDQLHESTVTTVTGARDSVLHIAPVRRPDVDESAVDGLPADLLRWLAARIMCGTECGESVNLPPDVAVELGRALVAAGIAGGAR